MKNIATLRLDRMSQTCEVLKMDSFPAKTRVSKLVSLNNGQSSNSLRLIIFYSIIANMPTIAELCNIH